MPLEPNLDGVTPEGGPGGPGAGARPEPESGRSGTGPEGALSPAAEAVTPPGGLPHAAVAIIRTSGDDPHYLLLRRADNPGDPWSGHFALPGGRREAGDRDILDTCIRETLEEIGLRLLPTQMIDARPWARAGGTAHATLVAPFLFEIPGCADLTLDTAEIAESHWLPRRYLLDPANHAQAVMVPRLPDRTFPCIKVGEGAIWGFTYGVLAALLGWPRP